MCYKHQGNLSIVGVYQLILENVVGKNVMFTPMNITANCALSHLGFNVNPVNRGYHWIKPAMIANTAPVLFGPVSLLDNPICILPTTPVTLHAYSTCHWSLVLLRLPSLLEQKWPF
jgi:hypothetical protein